MSKASPRVEAYGTLDELDSQLGAVVSLSADPQLCDLLVAVQGALHIAAAWLATPEGATPPTSALEEDHVLALEAQIDLGEAESPPFKGFIIPGGVPVAAQLQVARTVCRRAERRLTTLAEAEPVPPVLTKFLNRLSDLLFSLGRVANHRAGREETLVTDAPDLRGLGSG